MSGGSVDGLYATSFTVSSLQPRLQQLEQLRPREKRQVLQLIDAFVEREKLKQRVGGAER